MRRLLFALLLPLNLPAQSLLENGSFTSADGWPVNENVTLQTEAANSFLRLKSPAPGASVIAYKPVPLAPEIGGLELRFKSRHSDIRKGAQPWFDGRIILNFKDAARKPLPPSPAPLTFAGTSAEWTEHVRQFRVPPGAALLEFMPALFQAASGTLDLDDISLTPIPAAVLDAQEAADRDREAARIAALPKPKAQVPVPAPDKLPPPLHVEGNRLLTPQAKTVWLQGLAIPSMEWSAGGENILKSIDTGIRDWRANCIRLCLSERFWAGTGPGQKDGGMAYRQLVDDAVNSCAAHGVYIVLDLHAYRAPTQAHAEFWKAVAAVYQNHPAVIFELLNEPHDISWEVWRNGGSVTDQKKADTAAAAENAAPLVSFPSIGMQGLVDAIRATGAKNLLIAGGLDWGYDLTGILEGHALADPPGGQGIMYSSHVYPWKSDWQGKFLAVAARYPVFLGEVGADTRRMDFIPAERQEDPATWVPDILATIQSHHLHWTAWSFHPAATPRVIEDWSYTPTAFWGAEVKEALGGRKFTGKRLR